MKGSTRILWLLLAVVVAGVAGALSAVLLTRSSSGSGEGGAVSPPDSGAQAALLARLDALAEDNRALRERIAVLELRPAAGSRAPVVPLEGLVAQEEFDAFRTRVEATLARLGPLPQEPGEFQEQVAEALSTIRKQERVAQVRSSMEQRLAELDEMMPRLEQRLGLSAYQSNRMRSALLARYERDDELVRMWEDGADNQVLGERKASNHQAFREELSGFLSPQQQEGFSSGSAGGGGK